MRARPQTGPLRARVPPRSFETAERRAAEGVTWAALHRLAAALFHRDTASCQGSASRNTAMCMLRCLSRCRLLSSTEAWQDLCLCADSPRSSKAICVALAADGPSPGQPRQQEQELSFHLSAPILPLQPREPCTLCCTACRTHSAACHSLLGTQGGQRAALCSEEKGSNPTQSLCTAQDCSELALLDPIWDEG